MKNKVTYRKVTCDGIKADTPLVHEVGRVAETDERAVRVNVVLPTI